jgi:hypothetical protein
MNKYRKCKTKSIFREVAYQGDSPAVTTVTEELSPQGTIACLRSFSGWSGQCEYRASSLNGSETDKIVSVAFNKKDSGSTTLLDLFLPLHSNAHVFSGLGGSGGVGSLFNIPGPGIFFNDGLEVVISIPPNIGNGTGTDTGPIMACLNVVYSI